jgi:hypothetical protein
MSEIKIRRRLRTVNITLHTATSSATTLRLDDMAGAVVSLGTMSTEASSLHVYGAVDVSSPYRRLYGADGSAADITLSPSSTEGTIYALPDAAFALPYAKIVSGDTHSSDVSGTVIFKS